MLPSAGRPLTEPVQPATELLEARASRARSLRIGVVLAVTAGLLGRLGTWVGHDVLLLVLLSLPVGLSAWSAGVDWALAGVVLVVVGLWLMPVPPPPPAAAAMPPLTIALLALLLCGLAVLVGALRSARARALVLSQTEPLTGLLNRNAFMDRLQVELERSHRCGHPLAVAFLDCDDFKIWNDTHGHLAGDQLLISVARVLRCSTRSYDAVARMGGDEFAVMFPEASVEEAATAAQRLQHDLRQLSVREGWTVTFSMGVIAVQELPADPGEIITAADDLMYHAKEAGKDRFVCQSLHRRSHPRVPLHIAH